MEIALEKQKAVVARTFEFEYSGNSKNFTTCEETPQIQQKIGEDRVGRLCNVAVKKFEFEIVQRQKRKSELFATLRNTFPKWRNKKSDSSNFWSTKI